MKHTIQTAAALASIPWNAFMAAFLYYTLLAAIALGGASPSGAVVGTAYLAPLVAYGVAIAARLMSAIAHGWSNLRPLSARGH
jgi:hypothetical protein